MKILYRPGSVWAGFKRLRFMYSITKTKQITTYLMIIKHKHFSFPRQSAAAIARIPNTQKEMSMSMSRRAKRFRVSPAGILKYQETLMYIYNTSEHIYTCVYLNNDFVMLIWFRYTYCGRKYLLYKVHCLYKLIWALNRECQGFFNPFYFLDTKAFPAFQPVVMFCILGKWLDFY